MRWLSYLALIALAITAAVLGPLAFSAHKQPEPTQATGDLVYRSGSYSLRLLEQPCDHEELQTMVEIDGGIGDVKAAVVTMGTTQRAACWARNAGGSYVARDYRSGQSDGVIPEDWFKR